MGLNSISISRQNFKNSLSRKTPELFLKDSLIEGYTLNKDDFIYQPIAEYPAFHYNIEPDLQAQIGGPDGFFFGALRLAMDSELMINKDLSLLGKFSYGVLGDFDEITLASDSIIPMCELTSLITCKKEISLQLIDCNSILLQIHTRIFTRNLVLESLRECSEVMAESFYIGHLKKIMGLALKHGGLDNGILNKI
jgi:hypothetical protein